jgi:hypothetical protein
MLSGKPGTTWRIGPDAPGDIAGSAPQEFNPMQLQPARTFQPVPPRKEAIPYTSEAMRQDLDRLRGAWDDCQASRDRNAIYAYLQTS